MPSKRSREGYLLVDNRNSPGVPPEMLALAAAHGYPAPFVAAGVTYESATMTCAHCASIVILNPQRTRARGYCARCDDYVCDSPACNHDCRPFKKLVDETHNRLVLGLPLPADDRLQTS